MKLPSIQFYPADWKKDPGVQALTFHDRGVWFEILLIMHESSERGKLLLNGKAMPDEILARLLGLDKQILTNTLTTLISFGVASRDVKDNALVCRRMVRDEEIRKVRAECGKMGGNPDLVKQNQTTRLNQNITTWDKQKSTPSKEVEVEVEKEAESSPSKSGAEPPMKSNVLPYDDPEFVDLWANWLVHLKEKRKSLGNTAKACQLNKLSDMGLKRAIITLRHSITNNYQGLYEPHIQGSVSVSNKPAPTADYEITDHRVGVPESTFRQMTPEQQKNSKII